MTWLDYIRKGRFNRGTISTSPTVIDIDNYDGTLGDRQDFTVGNVKEKSPDKSISETKTKTETKSDARSKPNVKSQTISSETTFETEPSSSGHRRKKSPSSSGSDEVSDSDKSKESETKQRDKSGSKKKRKGSPKKRTKKDKTPKEEKKREKSPPVSDSPDLENDSISVAEGETSGRTKRPTTGGKCPKQFNSALVAKFWIEGGDDSDEDYVPSE